MKKSQETFSVARWAAPAILCAASTMAGAQQTLGNLNGVITDTSGAVISGAQVTLSGNGNGLRLETLTSSNGTYQFQNIPVGLYKLTFSRTGFNTSEIADIQVQANRTATLNPSLVVGSEATTVEVNEHPLLNQVDAVNGYVLDAARIQETPLATGSFTQLAIQAPGVSAELLSGIGTNNGLGNQPIWANGQRDTSNGFSVNGVDVTNLFNGKSSSASESGRLAFNIGQSSTGAIAGQQQTSTSVYGSNGNALASPAPEFSQEITVNTSSYNADQGNHSGAQINVTTGSGANQMHGQLYGHRASNFINAAPYFNKQAANVLETIPAPGQSVFNPAANPGLHRYTAGGTLSGPLVRNKLFYFGGYEYSRVTDDNKGISTLQVPYGLSDDRSLAGIQRAIDSYNATSNSPGNNGGVQSTTAGTAFNGTFDPVAVALLQAKFPNGQYLIPSAQSTAPAQLTANVFLQQVPVFRAQKATGGLDYIVSQNDRLSFKYYYQLAPVSSPFQYANTGGYPAFQDNGAQVGALSNTITFGPHINWEQRMGFSRQKANSTFRSILPNSNFGIGFPNSNGLPALTLGAFAYNRGGSVTVGPTGNFPNTGYFQNRWNPETNLIISLGRHNISTGGSFSYTQLNIRNRRAGQGALSTANFVTFVEGLVSSSSELLGATSRYYRANDIGAYVQDQWRILSNLTLTAGVRYDYNGGLREKYGNLFNFDPARYNVTDTTVIDPGFIVAGNNSFSPTPGVSDSTLTGRQWGIAPRLAFAYAPLANKNKVVFNGAFGLNYDRGEYFSYLSQPAGGGFSGPFGVTNAPPLVNQVNGSTAGGATLTLAQPLGSAVIPASSLDPAQFKSQLITAAQIRAQCDGRLVEAQGSSCGAQPANFAAYARDNKLPYIVNFSFSVQVQLSEDTTFQVGYAGNRGRHLVLPVPFNEPGIATPTNPIHGETASYGYEVLNSASPATYTLNGKAVPIYNPISGEPLNTQSGGNSDLRVPYVGYSTGATLFRAAGVSAYDALQTHLEKRMRHGVELGASYTFSHAHDEQSGIGLFFVGDNPNNLRDSYANSDFDRTHIFNAQYAFQLPSFAKDSSFQGKFTNGWRIVGTAQLQSGQAFSLYDFSGAVGSVYYGTTYNAVDPVVGIKDPGRPGSARTGNPGTQVSVTRNSPTGGPSTTTYYPTIDASQLKINNLLPGQKGIPQSQNGEPQDIFENDFNPGQRNIFRQSPQRSANLSFQKLTPLTERFVLRYTFDVFNVTNTASFDIPVNSVGLSGGSLAQGVAKRVAGQVVSSAATQAADYNKLYTFPTSSSTFGSIRNTIGQNRQIEMSLRLSF